jgi:hypothetical protein
MIVGGLMAVAPVFGPLGKTLHYLADFISERPQPMRGPDISFFAELLALIICSCLPYRWYYLSEVAREPRRAHDSDVRISPTDEANPATWVAPAAKSRSLLQVAGWLISLTHDLPSGFALRGLSRPSRKIPTLLDSR